MAVVSHGVMDMKMDICSVGMPTYYTRVEAWECDHNQHWNIRNYLRSFQQASDVVADMSGVASPDNGKVTRHSRFHGELFQTANVTVRSTVVADGAYAGALVHLLSSNGRLSATSLDQPGLAADFLPRVATDDITLALPRGLDGRRLEVATPWGHGETVLEHGFVHPAEVDHTGALPTEGVVRRVAIASNALLAGLGFNDEYIRTHKISRMGAEMKVTHFQPCAVGARLRSIARITSAGRSSLFINCWLITPTEEVVAQIAQCVLFVDMTSRRVTRVPEILRSSDSVSG